jgi:hypothetical protein
VSMSDAADSLRKSSLQKATTHVLADMKARQSAKIRELQHALVTAGYSSLDDQAKALGLSRSTTWTILKGNHKASGLSAATINRMLLEPRLPSLVRAKILEYVREKNAGFYGDNHVRLRKFTGRVSITNEARSQSVGAREREKDPQRLNSFQLARRGRE